MLVSSRCLVLRYVTKMFTWAFTKFVAAISRPKILHHMSDDSHVNATAPCMSRCTHFAQARPPMSCIPLVIYSDITWLGHPPFDALAALHHQWHKQFHVPARFSAVELLIYNSHIAAAQAGHTTLSRWWPLWACGGTVHYNVPLLCQPPISVSSLV